MTNQSDLWKARKLDGNLALELRAGDARSLVLAQGENRIRVDLSNVKAVVAALAGGAAGPSRDRAGDCPSEDPKGANLRFVGNP